MDREAILSSVGSGYTLKTEHPLQMGEQTVTYFTYKKDHLYVVEMNVISGESSNTATNKIQFSEEEEDEWIKELEGKGNQAGKEPPLDFWALKDRILKRG